MKSAAVLALVALAALVWDDVPREVSAQQVDWPYRFIISGPVTAEAGSQVTYVVSYEQVLQGRPESPAFVFEWPEDAASLVSTSVISGPEGVTNPLGDAQRWDFSEAPPSGSVEFILQVQRTFAGELTVSMYVPGNAINLPADSITEVTTSVTAPLSPATAPTTGGGFGDQPKQVALAGALALIAAASIGAALARQRARIGGQR